MKRKRLTYTWKERILAWYAKQGMGSAKECAKALGGQTSEICAYLIDLRKSGKVHRSGERGKYVYVLARKAAIKTYTGNADGTMTDHPGTNGHAKLGSPGVPILDPLLDFSTGAIQRVLEARVTFLEKQVTKVKLALEALQ